MTGVQGIRVMSVAAAVVLLAYVVAGVAGADLGGALGTVKIVVLVAAVVVAAAAYQRWSHDATTHSLSAMVVALLGGASLASAVTTATGADLYGSDALALVGTVAIVAAVTIVQVGQTRDHSRTTSPRPKDGTR